LFIATGLARSDDEVAEAVRELKLRGDHRDERFFAGRGFPMSEFQRLYRRLAVVFVASAAGEGVYAWSNPEATRRMPEGATAACVACLASPGANPGDPAERHNAT
jgi:hypothetical protein